MKPMLEIVTSSPLPHPRYLKLVLENHRYPGHTTYMLFETDGECFFGFFRVLSENFIYKLV